METVEKIAKRLVQIQSDSDKSKVLLYSAKFLKKLGGKVTVTKKEPRFLLARFGKPGGILFAGHLDTVSSPRPPKKKPGVISGGKLWGLGASDMKGGCAAVLATAQRLRGRVPFAVAFTTDEETRMEGAAILAKNPLVKKAAIIIIPEPTNMLVATSEKGTLQLEIRIWGKTAHGSMPWFGKNAAQRLVHFLSHLEFLQDPEMHLPDGITVNLGMLKAGTAANIVPDFASATIDVRYPPSLNPMVVVRRIRETLGGSGVKWEVRKLHEVEPLEFDVNCPQAQTFLRVADTRVAPVMYATEATCYGSAGKPILVCGPGRPELAHQQDEFVDVFQLKKAEHAYTSFCLALMKGK